MTLPKSTALFDAKAALKLLSKDEKGVGRHRNAHDRLKRAVEQMKKDYADD